MNKMNIKKQNKIPTNKSFCTVNGIAVVTGVVERDAVRMLLDPTTVADRNRKGKNDLRSVATYAKKSIDYI
jgi:hypothetical protein